MKQQRNGLTCVAATTHQAPTGPALLRQIAERAYQLFQQRGGSHGSDMEDWLTAEREVLAATRQRTTTARRSSHAGRPHPRSRSPKAA
jgi:hypothetical protein